MSKITLEWDEETGRAVLAVLDAHATDRVSKLAGVDLAYRLAAAETGGLGDVVQAGIDLTESPAPW